MPKFTTLPGTPEIWLVGGQAYVVYVYDFDFIDGEIPVAYKITGKNLEAAFGTKPVTYDKKITAAQFDQVGALTFGTSDDLAEFDKDPMSSWVQDYETSAEVRPWLNDAEVTAITLSAYLEGREVTDEEFEGTEWFQTHNEAQRNWLLISMSDPSTAKQLESDMRLQVRDMLRQAGVAQPSTELVRYMATEAIQGNWSTTYLEIQVGKVADPYAMGKLDSGVAKILRGGGIDQTQDMETEVQDLAYLWLGPRRGKMSKAQIQEWAGRIRNDPDAQDRYTKYLQRQRMAQFTNYTDPNMTYEDIAGMHRQDWQDIVGRIPDEKNDRRWLHVIGLNDMDAAGARMRRIGVNDGSKHTARSAVADARNAFSTVRSPI